MLKSLCASHGRVKQFSTTQLDKGEATVTYAAHGDAVRAQRALHMCLLGDCHIVAEFGADGGGLESGGGQAGSANSEWSVGTYEHAWSIGDDGADSCLLPAGLLSDCC